MDDNYGGIFDANSVLGVPTSVDGAGQKCELYYKNSEVSQQIQQALIDKGVRNLSADGVWGACSESAFQLVFGEPTSAKALQEHLGIECDGFAKSVKGSCQDMPVYSPQQQIQIPDVQMQPQIPNVQRKFQFPWSQKQSQQISPPPHTTQPIHKPPQPGSNLTPPGVQPQNGAQPTPWVKYGLVLLALAAIAGGVWWWTSKKPKAPSRLPKGRTQPVGTIE